MKQISIFCDGGFGNRYNSLVSGLAMAEALRLSPVVYWPKNNWCRAGFRDLFDYKIEVRESLLSELSGSLNDSLPLLHDEIASNLLGCRMNSAYAYESYEKLQEEVKKSEAVFYYPALIPSYVLAEDISSIVKRVKFHPVLVEAAKDFIEENIAGPYYGIHLRRTDLSIGYTDEEIEQIFLLNKGQKFFICSDNEAAESSLQGRENVFIRGKSDYVRRRQEGEWTEPTHDDDRRLYPCNVDRSEQSVLDAVVDLLILAHSTIVGYTGSTFQSVARLVGATAPICQVERPPEFHYPSIRQIEQLLNHKKIEIAHLIDVGENLVQLNRIGDALGILKKSLQVYEDDPRSFAIAHNLAVYVYRYQNDISQAKANVQKALALNPGFEPAQKLKNQLDLLS